MAPDSFSVIELFDGVLLVNKQVAEIYEFVSYTSLLYVKLVVLCFSIFVLAGGRCI